MIPQYANIPKDTRVPKIWRTLQAYGNNKKSESASRAPHTHAFLVQKYFETVFAKTQIQARF